LVKALGLRDDDEMQSGFEGALASLLEYGRQAARSRGKARKDAGLTEFVKEAAAIANARLSVDPVVAEVLRRLRESKADRKMQTQFPKLSHLPGYRDASLQSNREGAAGQASGTYKALTLARSLPPR
jgi:hypothetical protein